MSNTPDKPPLEIVCYPAPLLKKRSREVTEKELADGRIGELDLREFLPLMVRTMKVADGLGLAAPQVGHNIRLFVANPDEEGGVPPVICFNPVLSEESGSTEMEEGCLSLPGIRANIKRAERLVLTGVDEKGPPIRRECEGLEARIYQHEIDHLDGVLILQRMGTAQRFLRRSELRELEDIYELKQRRKKK
jgi:peptide deformylase